MLPLPLCTAIFIALACASLHPQLDVIQVRQIEKRQDLTTTGLGDLSSLFPSMSIPSLDTAVSVIDTTIIITEVPSSRGPKIGVPSSSPTDTCTLDVPSPDQPTAVSDAIASVYHNIGDPCKTSIPPITGSIRSQYDSWTSALLSWSNENSKKLFSCYSITESLKATSTFTTPSLMDVDQVLSFICSRQKPFSLTTGRVTPSEGAVSSHGSISNATAAHNGTSHTSSAAYTDHTGNATTTVSTSREPTAGLESTSTAKHTTAAHASHTGAASQQQGVVVVGGILAGFVGVLVAL